MTIFSNNLMASESRGGSVENALKTTPNADANASANVCKNPDDAAMDLPVFQLLLSGAVSGPMLAKSAATTTDAPADTPVTTDATDATTATPALNLFMALLPALPAQASANVPAPASSIGAIASDAAAATPAPQMAPLLHAADGENAALETAVSALLATTAMPILKKDETNTSSDTDAFDHALMTLDRTLQMPTSTPATAVASTPTVAVHDVLADLPMTHHEWPTALGHRLMWMAGEGVQKAELRINPEHLGPIHVQIQIDNDQTDVQFAALSPQAREALETSIPRLREMFAQQGLNLGQAHVFSQSQQQQQSGGRQPAPSSRGDDFQTAVVTAGRVPARVHVSTRLLDDYA